MWPDRVSKPGPLALEYAGLRDPVFMFVRTLSLCAARIFIVAITVNVYTFSGSNSAISIFFFPSQWGPLIGCYCVVVLRPQ